MFRSLNLLFWISLSSFVNFRIPTVLCWCVDGLNEEDLHRLICLHTESPGGITVWEGLDNKVLLKEVCHWSQLPVCSPPRDMKFQLLLQLPASMPQCCHHAITSCSTLEPYTQINFFFSELPWSQCLITAIEKRLI